jgi:hypothetical protein
MNRNIANNTLKIDTTVIISAPTAPKNRYFGKIREIRYDGDDKLPVEALVLFPMLGQLMWYGINEIDTLETFYGPAQGFKDYYEIGEKAQQIVTKEIGVVYNIRDIRPDIKDSVPCYTIRKDNGDLFYAYSFELEPVA